MVARRREDEQGFTLIELMVVVLIIAILIAIAIPTFLGARTRAQDKAAQSNVRNAVSAAKTIFTDGQDYVDATIAELTNVEPSLSFMASNAASTTPKEVSVGTADSDATVVGADTFYTVSMSKSGACFAARDIQASSNAGTVYAEVTSGACTADNAESGTWDWAEEF